MAQSKYYARAATGLTRNVSWFDVMGSGTMLAGPALTFVYLVWATSLYPGANMAQSTWPALGFNLLIATTYFLLFQSMPRTGGDYVYVSRIVHPIFGFVTSFFAMWIWLTAAGYFPVWALGDGVGALLWDIGTVTGSSAYLGYSQTILTPNYTAAIGVIITVLFILVMLRGTRASFRVIGFCFLWALIGIFVAAATLVLAGPQTIAARLQALTGMVPSTLISTAQNAGYVTGFTLAGTVLGSVYTIQNFNGFSMCIYYGGEVKDVRKTNLYAMYGALFIMTLVTFVLYQAVYTGIDPRLVHSLSFLYATGNSAYTLPVTPGVQTLMVFATNNLIVILIVGIGFILTQFACGACCIMAASRVMFAWSFDRVIPAKFSQLDKRTNTPYLIAITCGVVAVASTLIWVYTSFFTKQVFILPITALWYCCASLAAIVFPLRKTLFASAPPLVQKRIGGLPLVSIIGAATFVASLGLLYATLTPAYVGGPVTWQYIAFDILLVISAVAIWGIGYLYNKSKGMDILLSFKEVPPV